jgi:Gti1/Pac2 family
LVDFLSSTVILTFFLNPQSFLILTLTVPDVRGSLGQQRAGFIHLVRASLVGLETTGDALFLILEATRRGLIRRFVDSERKMITSGSVFVEAESGIKFKCWIDGFFWSPSRILGNFWLYRETDKRGAGYRDKNDDDSIIEGQLLSRPKIDNATTGVDKHKERMLVGSLTKSYKFKPDSLMKKGELTFLKDSNSGLTMNLDFFLTSMAMSPACNFILHDRRCREWSSPVSLFLSELASLDNSPEYLDKTHLGTHQKSKLALMVLHAAVEKLTTWKALFMPLLIEGRVCHQWFSQ